LPIFFSRICPAFEFQYQQPMNFVSSVYHHPIEMLFIQARPPAFFALLFPLLASSYPDSISFI
jgi:hypothetical protein